VIRWCAIGRIDREGAREESEEVIIHVNNINVVNFYGFGGVEWG